MMKLMKGVCDCLSPRSGREHKAWGGAQRNPRLKSPRFQARETGDSGNSIESETKHPSAQRQRLCRPLRGLEFLARRLPGVPLRSTPGFMLPPASRVGQNLLLT